MLLTPLQATGNLLRSASHGPNSLHPDKYICPRFPLATYSKGWDSSGFQMYILRKHFSFSQTYLILFSTYNNVFQHLVKSRRLLHLGYLQRSNLQLLQSPLTDTHASTEPIPSDLSSDGSTDPDSKETVNSPKTGQTIPPYPVF